MTILQMVLVIEALKKTTFSGYINANVRIDAECEKNDKPDWAVEDSDAQDIPVDGYPAP